MNYLVKQKNVFPLIIFRYEKPKTLVAANISEFRVLTMLNGFYNNSFQSHWPTWNIGGFGAYITFFLFASLRFHDKIGFFNFIALPVVLTNCSIIVTYFLILSAKVQELSDEYLRSLSAGSITKLQEKEIASFRPFGVKSSPFKIIRRVYLLIFYGQVSNIFVSVLFAFPA